MGKCNQVANIDEITREVEETLAKEEQQYSAEHRDAPNPESDYILKALKDNEDGDARLFIEAHKKRYCYDHSAGQWLIWNEHCWKLDNIEEVYRGFDTIYSMYLKEADRQANARRHAALEQKSGDEKKAESLEKELHKRVRDLQTLNRKKNILTLAAQGTGSLGVSGDEWDKNPYLLCCKNGVIDLKTGELRAGRPEDYIKTFAPTEWKGAEEPAQVWEGFLFGVFDGNRDLIDYIRRLLGYTITGSTKDHVIPIFWGHEGWNGKGTMFETLLPILGSFIGPIPSEMLTGDPRKRSSSGPSADIMYLRGRRLVWASETEEGGRFDVGRVKWLTGSDTLTGRPPHGKNQVTFEPTHKIILITNHKPQLPSSDLAMWKRIHLIPFTLSFVDDPQKPCQRKRDPDLIDKLKSEAAGILAWLVRGCLEWQQVGLKPPEIVLQATEQYQKDEDILSQFLGECTRTDVNGRVRAQVLFTVYKQWCESNGYKYLGGRKFGERMKDGYERGSDRDGNFYKGLCLIQSDSQYQQDGGECGGLEASSVNFPTADSSSSYFDFY